LAQTKDGLLLQATQQTLSKLLALLQANKAAKFVTHLY
jgi:hypothetical protein